MSAAWLIDFAGWYLWAGAAVALVFLTIGIDRLDEDARGAYAFRPLLIPGVLLIWPLILWIWSRAELGLAQWERRYSPPRAAHGVAAGALLLVVTLTLMTGVTIRQSWPEGIVPERLSAPGATQ